MVPDDAARPRAADRPRRVAPVPAEHKAAPTGDEVLVESGCLPRVAAVVEEHKSGPGVPVPELEPGAHLSPLNRIAARQRQGRAYFTARIRSISRCRQYSGRVANKNVEVARGYHERTKH